MPTPPSPRTEVRRKPQRADYDPATVAAIIDQALICHIAFNEGGSVHCLPTACWRDGEYLYIHGANKSRLTNTLLAGECAVAITHLDGLVFARSAMRHSMNYRSAVIYGRFVAVDDLADKKTALAAFVEHVSPGRTASVREASPAELAGTRVLRLPLAEAAAKCRRGGPDDAADDLARPVWAGVVPLLAQAGKPQSEAGCAAFEPPRLHAAITV